MLDTVNQLNFAAVKFGGFSSVWVIISLAAQGPHAISPPLSMIWTPPYPPSLIRDCKIREIKVVTKFS